MPIELNVNGKGHKLEVDADTPLLYVLRNELQLNGAKFGCGLAQCGACTVLVDGAAARSCVLKVGTLVGKSITTLEHLIRGERLHALQQAFIAEQAAQCGYCTSGMIMSAHALLARTPQPTEAAVRGALDGNLCRCGTHNRIVRAVLRAANGPGAS
jgi:nicotinate dehydrogenase subunit A